MVTIEINDPEYGISRGHGLQGPEPQNISHGHGLLPPGMYIHTDGCYPYQKKEDGKKSGNSLYRVCLK